MADRQEAWWRGFEDGFRFHSNSPYMPDTQEDGYWHDGWIEGALKLLCLPYYKSLEEKDSKRGESISPENAEWRKRIINSFFKKSS